MGTHCTVVSLVPFKIQEFKPGIYPGYFEIPPCKEEKPQLLHVGDSVCHIEIDENRTITVTMQSENVAKSLVSDYIISNIGYSIEDNSVPGIFYVPGKLELKEVLGRHSDLLRKFQESQRNWFVKLVEIADDDWEKTRQHKFISNMSRYAAKALNMKKEWLITPEKNEDFIKCPSCTTLLDPAVIVCPNCRCIMNLEKYKTLQFADVK